MEVIRPSDPRVLATLPLLCERDTTMRSASLPCGSWPVLGVILLIFGNSTRAQTPATADQWVKTVDLTNRYQFVEHYAREGGPELPGSLPPYRVGVVEVAREVIDQPKGAPRRSESTRQTVFVERTSEQAGVGGVSGSVRFIERFSLQPADPSRTMGPTPLDGQAVSLRYRGTDWPIVAPTADRKPTDFEFEAITHQIPVALLSQVLPPRPVRIGDSWEIPRRGGAVLLGDPLVRGELLTGKFTELRKQADGPKLAATISVTGRVTSSMGDAGVNAAITFTGQPDAPIDASGAALGRPAREGLIEARGGITEVRLARSTTGPLPGPGRLKFQSTREITLERRFDIGDVGAKLPELPPTPKLDDPATWITWLDPGKRFRFDHPQDLLPPERPALAPVEPNVAVLARTRREGVDLIQVDFVGKTLTPDDLKAKLAAKTGLTKYPVIKGEEGWLPENEWPNGKVYRIEAAVQVPEGGDSPSSRGTRIHFDAFLIQPGQAAGILAIATTSREPVAPFRREVEQILKTLQIDPAGPDAGK